MGCDGTRRELVRSAVAGAAAAAMLEPLAAGAASTAAPSDSAIVIRTLEIEQLVVISYERVLDSGLLTRAASAQVRSILHQERQHVAVLQHALRGLGGTMPHLDKAAAQRELAAHHVHDSLAHLRSQRECLKLLIDVESLAEGAYFWAISRLVDPVLLRAAVEAMGSEAQHWTLLSGIQHPGKLYRSVPYPFVQGSP